MHMAVEWQCLYSREECQIEEISLIFKEVLQILENHNQRTSSPWLYTCLQAWFSVLLSAMRWRRQITLQRGRMQRPRSGLLSTLLIAPLPTPNRQWVRGSPVLKISKIIFLCYSEIVTVQIRHPWDEDLPLKVQFLLLSGEKPLYSLSEAFCIHKGQHFPSQLMHRCWGFTKLSWLPFFYDYFTFWKHRAFFLSAA